MNQGQFETIRRIFEEALQKDPASRNEFLKEACNGDEDVQREVNHLLVAHDSPDSWIDREGESIIRPHSVTFKSGTKIGSYEILELIGVGGMGEVYRARDANLPSRQVAIKVIPETFSSDPERVARFEREAQVLASMSHPHIGAIHHVVESNSSRLLVLELVEGETLAQRLTQGPIPLPESLTYARQIAEALDYAHDKGIIHRDLKPANIKITPDDQIKVLDFGLAKVRDDPGTNLNESPTVSVTAPARLLGTAAYMSPEQATGKEADRRSDIWAFGCVLYEMLTGRVLFAGESVSEILAEVLKSDPDFKSLPISTPQSIRRLLRRCLQKDRKRRQRHIGDARLEIDDAENGVQEVGITANRMSRREWLAWGAASAIGAASLGAIGWLASRPTAFPIRFGEYALRPTLDPVSMAISRDGSKILFAATEGIVSQLYLLEPGKTIASVRRLEGTDGAYLPFWSPDGRRFGFFAKSGLHIAGIDGGLQKLRSVSLGRGGTWNARNEILYSANPGTWISKVDVESRESKKVTQLGQGHVSHRFPQFIDDTHFLYYVTGKPEVQGVWVHDIANQKSQPLQLAQENETVETAVFASPGFLLYLIKTTEDSRISQNLFVQDFSLDEMAPVGGRTRVPFVNDPVMVNTAIYRAALSVGEGCLSYRTGSASGQRQLEWRDEKGYLIETVGGVDPRGPLNPSLSSDGRAIVLDRTNPDTGNTDVFRLNVQIQGKTVSTAREPLPLTRGDEPDYSPVWSRKRDVVIFSNNENGPWNLYEMSARDGRGRTLILESDESKFATDWSSNEEYILFRSINPEGGYDLRVVRYFDKHPRQEFGILPKGRPSDERDGQFSPDVKWIAYSSNEDNDQFEIFVLLFPKDLQSSADRGVQVSLRGGTQPRWGRKNPAGHPGCTELFYLDLNGTLVRALISTGSDGQPFVMDRSELFRTGIPPENPVGAYAQQYAVFEDDGRVRFLLNVPKIENPPPLHLIVDIDWKSRR